MDYYSQLTSIMPEQELKDRIEEKIKEYQGYISEEIAAKLLAKEFGVYKEEIKFFKISEIKEGQQNINLIAKVKEIEPIREYPSGKRSRSLIIEDESKKIELVFWEQDIGKLNNIHLNDEIEVNGIYERNERISFGYKAKIKVNSVGFETLKDPSLGKKINIKGKVGGIEGKKNGAKKEYFVFYITDGKNEKKVIIWDGIERGERIETNDSVLLENVNYKDGAFHINSDSRMLVKKEKNRIKGEIKEMELNKDELKIKIGDKEIKLNKDDAYKFLGVKEDEEISLDTICSLKKEKLLNKEVVIVYKDNKIQRITGE